MTKPSKPAVLSIRNARLADVNAISALVAKVYKDMPAYTPGMLRGQIAAFPDGQFVVEYADEIVGYAAGFRIDEKTAMAPHTWTQITGGGYAARHDHPDRLYCPSPTPAPPRLTFDPLCLAS